MCIMMCTKLLYILAMFTDCWLLEWVGYWVYMYAYVRTSTCSIVDFEALRMFLWSWHWQLCIFPSMHLHTRSPVMVKRTLRINKNFKWCFAAPFCPSQPIAVTKTMKHLHPQKLPWNLGCIVCQDAFKLIEMLGKPFHSHVWDLPCLPYPANSTLIVLFITIIQYIQATVWWLLVAYILLPIIADVALVGWLIGSGQSTEVAWVLTRSCLWSCSEQSVTNTLPEKLASSCPWSLREEGLQLQCIFKGAMKLMAVASHLLLPQLNHLEPIVALDRVPELAQNEIGKIFCLIVIARHLQPLTCYFFCASSKTREATLDSSAKLLSLWGPQWKRVENWVL